MQSTVTNARSQWAKADPFMAFGRPLQRISVDQYHRMIEAGVFSEGERCELIRGVILEKAVPKPPHAYAVDVLSDLLRSIVGTDHVVRSQQPITTSDSEPEPDVSVASGVRKDYLSRHPDPNEVELVIEVADSSLRGDRTTKLELYAGSSIAYFWIVNLVDRCIEVYSLPRTGKNHGYRKSTIYNRGDSVPVFISGKKLGTILVDEILP